MRKTADKPPQESRAAEAVTVFWMLTMMATLGAELVSLVSYALIARAEDPATLPLALRMLPGLLQMTALVTGLLCLLLTPVAYKLRRVPPPGGVLVIAVAVGAFPLVTLLLMQLIRA
jgi:hypothetical protein